MQVSFLNIVWMVLQNAVLYCFINQSLGPLGKQQGILEEPCDVIPGGIAVF